MDLNEVLLNYDENNMVHQIAGNVIIHMGTYEIIKALDVKPEDILGTSIGSLTAAYAKNILTFEEVVNITAFTASVYRDQQNKGSNNNIQEKLTMFLKQLLLNKTDSKLNKMMQNILQSLFSKNEETIKLPHSSIVLSCGSTRFECFKPISLEILKEKNVEDILLNLGK